MAYVCDLEGGECQHQLVELQVFPRRGTVNNRLWHLVW